MPSTSSEKEDGILNNVKNTMGSILAKLDNQDDTTLNTFLKTKIKKLKMEKKQLVGVFGKTGSGKTSLINTVIQEKKLLPSGSVDACTSVMIKVEANKCNGKYEAEIEFISPEEWEDELGSLLCTAEEEEHDKDDDDHEAIEKLTALYEEEWREKSKEQLMEPKNFKEIPEFLFLEQKKMHFESAEHLCEYIIKYTKNGSGDTKYKSIKKWYWPIVKSVTVRVPNNDFLQNVTLVDLPGNGDRNKSRDRMWQGIIGDCSAVWVVTEINRAVSEREAWEILQNVSGLIGNGGECQHIHIIATKSDDIGSHSVADTQAYILQRNEDVKGKLIKEINKMKNIKEHFSDDCIQVFTVSSKEFLTNIHLSPENTEIPRLQEFLQNLNDSHSETIHFVSGACGILSLMHGARLREENGRNKEVRNALDKNLSLQTESVRNEMAKIRRAFEEHLQEGVEKSKSSCEEILKAALYPKGKSGKSFHKQLKKVVENGGIWKPKKGKEINLNMKLTSCLTESIDKLFRETFPKEGHCGPFNGAINNFTLGTDGLKQTYKDVELQLLFLKSEEDLLKTSLSKTTPKQKKTVYTSLIRTIEKSMQDCYKKAVVFSGSGTLQNMRETIKKHVFGLKNNMFEHAKIVMHIELHDLMEEILRRLERTMKEATEVSGLIFSQFH
ncbi:PREDICTED: nuclear GTPase SLIP-GC-like [Cyprinodon variegatus]|uniref:nuclear GTPase SLIP-GC-like n=1 Tax=Cyprinodon variegatus TaxID=28743 RepID=UPI0007425AD7|nr:PREDICTED: nuclear GTPase SLIP-GC-like [Cyprinodon variegatus]